MISEWAEFQVWKFLHLQKLAGKEKFASQAVGPWEARLFFPRANFKVKFPYLKSTAHSCKSPSSDEKV
jgi:hypothetical protein